MRHVLPAFHVLLLLLAASPAAAQSPATQTLAAWTELTGQGTEVRAAAGPGGCPAASVDGRPAAMAVRAQASAEFPQVCTLVLPAGATSVEVDGRPLPLPAPARRIVILGDTGCRIKDLTVQACNDPQAWPFAEVARLAAANKPDLVIHVGDYYYRESPCPLDLKACAGSPSGDRWDTWSAEFFGPAAPLLAAAPWVFARGNHETCDRGGRGWYLLLDAGPSAEPCRHYTTPFAVHTGDLNLYVLDSALTPDRNHDKAQVAAVTAQLDKLGAGLDAGHGWIIVHRPVWGLVPVARLGPSAPFEVGLNFTEQDAFRGRALPGVQMIVSGHVHHFQALDFGPGRPAQLVVGTGGDVGIKADLPRIYTETRPIDGLDASVFSFSRYGYYLMEKDGEDWTGTFHDADDQVRARCRLHDRRLTCQAPR
ncbi:MAG TPA: metallophosphoesterase family protein [Caulobacteraceae bacterium]|jgi:hypothetical protein